jgi:ferric-dicitrate binding protein FerR (iron transport regulator)
MNCDEFLQVVDAWALGEDSAEAREHSERCAACRGSADAALRLVAGLDRLSAPDPESAERARRVLAAVDAAPARPIWMLAGAAAILILTAVALLLQPKRPSFALEGEARVLRGDRWIAADRGALLGDRLMAGARGATVKPPSGDEIRLAPGSEATLDAARSLALHSGTAEFSVVRRAETFEIRVPSGKILVRGTQFRVEVIERSKPMKEGVALLIAVMSGAVDFVSVDGIVTPVHAGKTLTVSWEGLTSISTQDPARCCEKIETGWLCNNCGVLADTAVVDLKDHKGIKVCIVCAANMAGTQAGISRAVVRKVDCCVRVYYGCADCQTKSSASEKCHGKERVRVISRARVDYACGKCNQVGPKAGVCGGSTASRCAGTPLLPRCSAAGKSFPHTE